MKNKNENINVRDVIQIDSELIENIEKLVENKSNESLLNILTDLHEADIAEIINHLDVDEATYTFSLLDTETAGEVITELDENLRERILANITTEKITKIVDELESDDATDILSELSQPVFQEVLDGIDKDYSDEVKELLKYPEDSAGGLMNSDFVSVQIDATVEDAIAEVRKFADEIEHIYHIYVIDKNEELKGIVLLKSLLKNTLNTKLSEILEEDLIYVTPEVDQEVVASLMEKYDVVSIPVVDDKKRMLGRITFDDIVDVINEEATEDIQKIAGLSEEQEHTDSIFRISRIRLPWLIIALGVELIGAVVLRSYEEFITQFIVATFFIPVVMAMGGSSGTQAAIVMVRGLTTKEIWLNESLQKLSKEFFVAILNGIVCAVILLGASILFFNDITSIKFALVLSFALLAIIITATMVGATIPLVLRKFGADPAVATGPFVTTMNDVLGLIIYLSFITFFFIS
ncbi:MAG: magnesium transporter [Melioribacteraceae bacterium]|nr:magnesium transporter [Melioribacteraceae bacterium]MCF8356176.1 magnesium transporter [Melioribacteraceae bacterium]MCF8394747.1 magnesium transporter [Melioribacteraceae bacterium]MCF8417953.1 magnesium transporter [Melioribacteraceae bacterium]